MSRPLRIKEPQIIHLPISKAQHEQIVRHAMEQSRSEKRILGVSEMVRRALEACYPVPKDEQHMKLF